MKESIARHIFKPLVHALKHIHSNGYVHRDIKSDNIMISDFCFPKILDFGFSSKLTGEDDHGFFKTKLGTPAYMAPEIHSGTPYQGASVDKFALGVILFQMVMGRPPFEEAKSNDYLYKCIVAKRPDIFWRTHFKSLPKKVSQELSEEFKDLIIGLFHAEPENRLTLDQVLGHKWIRIDD